MTTILMRGATASPTTEIVLAIWPQEVGDYTLTFNGTSEVITISDVSERDACTWRTFSGLAPGSAYPVSVSGPEGSETTTMTTASDAAHVSVYSSCFQQQFEPSLAVPAMTLENPAQVLLLGDTPYIDSSGQWSADPTDLNFRLQHVKFFNRADTRLLCRAGMVVRAASDHDYLPGNDAPGRSDLVAGPAGGNAFPGATACNYTEILCADEAEWVAMQASLRVLWRGLCRWPANPEAGQTFGGGTVPADGEYSRWTLGRCEYFVVDQFSYCEYRTSTGATTNRRMLGAVQEAWLLARLAASTATFKVILSPQHLLTQDDPASDARNDYGHTSYADERGRLLAALTDTSAWAVPGGVVLLTGDVHTPEVYWYSAGEGVLQINPCPGGTGFTAQQDGIADATDTTTLWWEQFPASGEPLVRYYGTVEDTGSGPLVLRLKDSGGNTRFKALLDPGTNTPRYERRRIGR